MNTSSTSAYGSKPFSSAFSDSAGNRFAGEKLATALRAAVEAKQKVLDVGLSTVGGSPMKTDSGEFDQVAAAGPFRKAAEENSRYFDDFQARSRGFASANGLAPTNPPAA